MTGLISKRELFSKLPPPWPEDLRSQIRTMVAAQPDRKLVVLDDDPTGTQTVYDVPVLTTWEVETLRNALAGLGPCFYILTNSRSLPTPQAAELSRQVTRNLREAVWREAGFDEEPAHARQLCCRAFTLISRSDSTLRGHYPLETDILTEELGPFDATILIPYFEAGGRFTIGDTHYVADGDALVPAAETAFARDVAFGYRSSNLRDYVEEKTGGRAKASEVISFSVNELRTPSSRYEPTREVFNKLLELQSGGLAIVNACAPSDLEFFAAATFCAEQAGGRYLFRTAAQFVSARLGLEPQPLWNPKPNGSSKFGGLTVVGSYVPKTSEQLERLLKFGSTIAPIELSVTDLLESKLSIPDMIRRIHEFLSNGRDVVLYTSRKLVTAADAAGSLDIGNRISKALVEIVRCLNLQPRYLIAKGGITSSDLATRGLGVKRAMVLGCLLPGVPVWELGEETRFPGMPYIVFPGNVGSPAALTEAVQRLSLKLNE